MKRSNKTTISFQAKLIVTAFKVVVLSFFLFAFTAVKMEDEVWKQLGLSKKEGNSNISQSFLYGYLNYYGARNAKNIALGNRAAIVKDLGAYAKQFVNSEEFKKEYREHREGSKPAMPKPAKTIDEVRNEQVTAMKKSITQLEAMQKMDNADLRKMAAENVGALKKQLKELEDPNSALIKMMADGEKMRYEIDMKNFDDQYTKWEKENPENHMILVKSRLQKLLDVTADVDFQAELKEQYGKKRFVNPVYERKPDEWKQAFRAGKEATEAARAFAKQWISEIG
jgi:hypothetical protein